jgi:hypothetical protein
MVEILGKNILHLKLYNKEKIMTKCEFSIPKYITTNLFLAQNTTKFLPQLCTNVRDICI